MRRGEKMKRLLAFSCILIYGMVFISGCAGRENMTAITPAQDLEAPEWVMQGSGAFGGDKGKGFYGVASAFPIKNFSLHRAAADTHARNEAAKVFQFYTASLMKDYAASTVANDPTVTSELQQVEQAIRTVTAMTLSDAEIVDHWQDPASGELFALARLDLASFKDNFDTVQTLGRNVKDYIRNNADRIYNELEKEEVLRRGE